MFPGDARSTMTKLSISELDVSSYPLNWAPAFAVCYSVSTSIFTNRPSLLVFTFTGLTIELMWRVLLC